MVGQGIIKALRVAHLPVVIIGADIHALHSALFRTDESILLPKVEEKGSLSIIIERIKEKRIDVVMIGSEYDLDFFSENKETIQKETGALVIVSSIETIRIAGDKWLTVNFLKKNNLPYPQSSIPENVEQALEQAHQLYYPIILKPRSGTSSRNVYVVNSDEELRRFFPIVTSPILQKIISPSLHSENILGDEYTCSVFKCEDGQLIGPFTARRFLRGGDSWVVEVVKSQELRDLLLVIGSKLPIVGSFNVQLICTEVGPVPFEMNARFSGTTAIRAHFGFNEPEMAIRSYFLKEKIESPNIRYGLALRYMEEVFVDGISAESVIDKIPVGEVERWF